MEKRLNDYCVLQQLYGSRHLSLSAGCIRSSHHIMLYDDHWHVVHQGRAAVSGRDLLSCNGVGSMVGGILTYAIGQIQTFPVWRAVFLICGGVTILWGIGILIFLPDNPIGQSLQ
jgi:hypothetical protein